jgi:hypothetical protein
MSNLQTWVVCEQSGRWAAALRLAITRRSNSQVAPRLYEVRGLAELMTCLKEQPIELALVEIGHANLAEVFELLADSRAIRSTRILALLHDSLIVGGSAAFKSMAPERRLVVDALWEAGAVDVLESPRSLNRLFALGERLAEVSVLTGRKASVRQPVAEWAWSLLPWQDA